MEIVRLAARKLTSLGIVFFTASCGAVDDWQTDRLLQPTPAQLAVERRGAVVIYDGLEVNQINYAMDRHFDRIQNMMFVRIHHLPPPGAGGEVAVEEDGCE